MGEAYIYIKLACLKFVRLIKLKMSRLLIKRLFYLGKFSSNIKVNYSQTLSLGQVICHHHPSRHFSDSSDINSENYILDETQKKESKVTDQDELKAGEAVVTKIGLPSLADDPEIQQAASDINSENYILDETKKKESKVTDQDELKAGEAVVTKIGLPSLADDPEIQ